MNTFALINKIRANMVKVITPKSKYQKQIIMENSPNTVNEIPQINKVTSIANQSFEAPDANISPVVVNMIKSKQGEIDSLGNDLSAYAMESCIGHNGGLIGFQNVLENVLMNYKVEADMAKQDVESELVMEINKLNNHIIKLNNEIHSIELYLIPEKEDELKKYENQIDLLMNHSNPGISSSLSSERLTIIQLATARSKELIRELKQKVVELKTEIDQTKLGVEGLKMQISQINFYNESALRRRLGLFFNYWLIALEVINTDIAFVEKTKNIYNQYLNSQIELINAA